MDLGKIYMNIINLFFETDWFHELPAPIERVYLMATIICSNRSNWRFISSYFTFLCDKTRVWAVVYESVVFWNWLLILINRSQERCCVPIYVYLWCTDVSWCKITETIKLQNSPTTFRIVRPLGFQGYPENWTGINFPNKTPKGSILK